MGSHARLTLRETRQIRRGLLLAQNDDKAFRFEAKYARTDPELNKTWRELFDQTERIIMGDQPYDKLTMKAYKRMLERLRSKSPVVY